MKAERYRSGTVTRVMAAVLTLVMLVGMLPTWAMPKAQAASWAQEYLDKLVSWGVLQGYADGSLGPDQPLTRAEYVTMINRAYGYDETGASPFTDVQPSDWFSDDIAIAYNTGYFMGTSENTATPNGNLTREQAVVILGRNMRLQGTVGEATAFTDGRELTEWSRGMVQSAAEMGLVNGYTDGSFRPKNSITRAEMAALLAPAIGTPLQSAGDYSLGGVYGNVTISTSGVTLRNTTITGDLYLTGGIGLGSTTLENVTVLGKIIISGAGESDKGENSIMLRNVQASEMVVDGLTDWFVTVRAEGDTEIASTSVRTPAYLEDATPAGLGLKYIELNGENGIALELAGNIGEVLNRTPGSKLSITQGSVDKLTVDELATGSTLTIAQNAVVKNLNLDVGTNVSGQGDIDNLNVNSNGSTVTILPDKIVVRPGVSTSVSGETMDNVTAAEASQDPKILAGYPAAKDVAPTSATASFSTNKRGTVYWAVSAVTDGSVSEDDLISPPAYGSNIITSGKISATESSKEFTAKVTKLTSDGSYYLSAVLVDSREEHSPVKVSSFSTPDDTTPNFASGYPVMSKITSDGGSVTVMPTKSCQLYYALLPKGGTAPKAADFKANAITGNLGYGSIDVTKNVTSTFVVNSEPLDELGDYDLYLWLTDFDGAKSSAVKKLSFKTIDGTPPTFTPAPYVTAMKTTSIGFTFRLSEAGTVYWAAVKTGAEYLKEGTDAEPTNSMKENQIKVASGINALKSGKANASEGKDGTFTISGLAEQTTYDIYYVGMDKAGNYSQVGMITANTLDEKAPTVTQEFTRFNGNDKETPLADTDIRLVFNEGIMEIDAKQNPDGKSILALYQAIDSADDDKAKEAKEAFAAALRRTIILHDATGSGTPDPVKDRASSPNDWVIDYTNAVVTQEDTKIVITFRTDTDSAKSALNLKSGSTYYFLVKGLADTSSAKNIMGDTRLKDFTTVFAQVNVKNNGGGVAKVGGQDITMHMSFQLEPVSTEKVADGILWDMLIWSDSNVSFKLYQRIKNADGSTKEDWKQVGGEQTINSPNGDFIGKSLTRNFTSDSKNPTFERLNQLKDTLYYEYGIEFTNVEGLSDPGTWSQTVNCRVNVAAAGNSSALSNLSAAVTAQSWEDAKKSDVTSVGLPDPRELKRVFTDQAPPKFVDGYPTFDTLDTSVTMNVLLDRPGTVYYVVAPVGQVTTRDTENKDVKWEQVPDSGKREEGAGDNDSETFELNSPGRLDITSPKYSNSSIKKGNTGVGTGVVEIPVVGLSADTEYYVYFVLQGTAGLVYTENVLCYKFKTEPVIRPIIDLQTNNPDVNVKVDRGSTVDYLLVVSNYTESLLETKLHTVIDDTKGAEWARASYGSDYTVRNALLEDHRIDGKVMGSVFDYFAKQTTKDSMADLIRNRNVNNTSITLKKGVHVDANTTTSINCSPGMSGITQYLFLAVAKSDAGSGDAFRAVEPVFLRDSSAPQIVSAEVAITNGTSYPVKLTDPFKGTLRVAFNENLYWYQNDTKKLRKVIHSPDLTTADDYVPLGYACTLPTTGGIRIQNKTSQEPIQVMDFTVTMGRNGDSIVIPNNLSDAGSNTRQQSLTMKIVYVPIRDEETNQIVAYQPTLDVTSAWDARA